MRRLIFFLFFFLFGCNREKIRLEPTEEGAVSLSSSIDMGDPRGALQLVKGFHHIEQKAWRWTAGRFAVTLRTPEGASQKGARLELRFTAPEPAVGKLGPVTLTALASARSLGSVTCKASGPFVLSADVPLDFLQSETATFDFVLDKFLPPGTLDGRELGIIASSVSLRSL